MDACRTFSVADLQVGWHYPQSQRQYVRRCQERSQHTLEWIERRGLRDQRILEIGLGATGVACQMSGAEVSAWDIADDFADSAKQCGIRFQHANLNDADWRPTERDYYDVVILQEVIEHLYRPPRQVFERIRSVIRPGGVMVVTTLNLVRLSNRFRLAGGKGLFAPFEPESLVMGHLREYTLDELAGYLHGAGFSIQEQAYYRWDLGRWAFLRPLLALVPQLSSYLWVVGKVDGGE